MKTKIIISMLLMLILLTAIANAESNPSSTADPFVNSTGESEENTAETTEPKKGMFDPWFEAYTSVSYSSGNDNDWAYGNQRKEFSVSKPCYVRISNSIVAPWHWGYVYGLGDKITVTYRFTGVNNCDIEVSDGFLTKHQTGDSNIVEYTRTIEAKSSKQEDSIIFQYTPHAKGSVTVEIIYDEQVESKYDARNTVYFVEDEW